MLAWWELSFACLGVSIFHEQLVYIYIHGYAAGSLGMLVIIIPCKVYSWEFFLPIQMLSRSSARGSWVDLVRADFRHIWCQNHPLSRQIRRGTIYGARYQLLWLPHFILLSRDAYSVGHWQACLTTVSHSNPGEYHNKSINSGPIAWDYIPQLIIG